MTKLLDGKELAGYIKERQAKEVRALRQAHHIIPKLVIVQTRPDPVIDKYVGLKKAYGEDILVEVEHKLVEEDKALEVIKKLNDDDSVHGLIIQLPLQDKSKTDELVNAVAPEKDVDGLGERAIYDPATPMAINWLLTGYNVDLASKNIVVVGRGRLVGAPLIKMWQNSGLNVKALGKDTEDLGAALKDADVIVTATGVSGLITSDMVPLGAAVVDAATSSEDGKIVGDVAPDVRKRSDLTITPERGGVGPLTVTALFDNVIRAARQRVSTGSLL